MSVERSHGKPRLTRPRLSDTPLIPAELHRRRRDHGADGRFKPGNMAGGGRGANLVIERPEESVLETLGGLAEHAEAVRVVRDIRTLYRATRSDLASAHPIVRASAAVFARETVLAGVLFAKAAERGLTTPEGMRLLELSHHAEQRAERASVHAVAMAARLVQRRPAAIDATPWLTADDGPAVAAVVPARQPVDRGAEGPQDDTQAASQPAEAEAECADAGAEDVR